MLSFFGRLADVMIVTLSIFVFTCRGRVAESQGALPRLTLYCSASFLQKDCPSLSAVQDGSVTTVLSLSVTQWWLSRERDCLSRAQLPSFLGALWKVTSALCALFTLVNQEEGW